MRLYRARLQVASVAARDKLKAEKYARGTQRVRDACRDCFAGQNDHFQSEIVVSQPPSLFFCPVKRSLYECI